MLGRNKKYIEGMKDGAKPYEDTLKELADNRCDLRQLVEIFGKRKTTKLLKIYSSTHPVKIKIINDNKENYDIADNLRKTFNEKHFDCTVRSYSQYKSLGRDAAAYVIFLEDYEKLENQKINIVYKDKFGCKIYKRNNLIVISHNKDVAAGNKEHFFKYYEKVLQENISQNKKINEELEKKNKLEDNIPYIKMLDSSLESMDKNALVGTIKGIFSIAMLPWGLADTTIRAIVDCFRENRVDDNIISEAQKQILIVKLIELMEEERFKLY